MINSRRVGKGLIPPIQSLLYLILWTHTRTHLAYAHRPTCVSVTHMPTTPGNQKKTFTKQECPILDFPRFPPLYTGPIVIKIDPSDSAELRSLASDSRESNIGQTELHLDQPFPFNPPLPPNSSPVQIACINSHTMESTKLPSRVESSDALEEIKKLIQRRKEVRSPHMETV